MDRAIAFEGGVVAKTSTQWYRENPEKYEARKRQIKDRQLAIKERIREYRKDKPCVYCGFSDPRAIDFHHRDPSMKLVNPCQIFLKGWGWKRVLKELDKCDPVCKNCHAILHADERAAVA